MATIRPSDPRQLLEDAATTYGSFADVRPETLPGEIPGSDLPVLAIDPREEEEEHEEKSNTKPGPAKARARALEIDAET